MDEGVDGEGVGDVDDVVAVHVGVLEAEGLRVVAADVVDGDEHVEDVDESVEVGVALVGEERLAAHGDVGLGHHELPGVKADGGDAVRVVGVVEQGDETVQGVALGDDGDEVAGVGRPGDGDGDALHLIDGDGVLRQLLEVGDVVS